MMPQVILKHISDRDHGESMEIYVDDILVRTLSIDIDTNPSETFELKKSVIFDFLTTLENQGFEIVRDEHYKR